MARIITKMTVIARIAIHAPARNLVTSTTISTTAVTVKPKALIARLRIIRVRAR